MPYLSRPELLEKENLGVLIVDSEGMRSNALRAAFQHSDLKPSIYQTGFDRDVGSNAEFERIVSLSRTCQVDFVYMGGDDPIVAGLGSALRLNNILSHGPNHHDAKLEGDKIHFKRIATSEGVDTAPMVYFSKKGANHLFEHLRQLDPSEYPKVLKDPEPALGKAAIPVENADEAVQAGIGLFNRQFSNRGNYVMVEDFSVGNERSYHYSISDGVIIEWEVTVDHKQAKDWDEGPMTGGNGIAGPIVAPSRIEEVRKILRWHPDYRGRGYPGFKGEDMLEFNARDGSPEIIFYLPRFRGDFLRHSIKVASGLLEEDEIIEWDTDEGIVVVGSSPGYPDSGVGGLEITGYDQVREFDPDNIVLYPRNRDRIGQATLSTGGREYAIYARGKTREQARDKAYAANDLVRIGGKPAQIRTDIGLRPGD